MARLEEITGKALSGEWGNDDLDGTGVSVLRTTNFTNEGIVNYNNVVTRSVKKKNIEEKFLCHGDIIIEKSGGSDTQPVGRVVYFDGPEKTYLFNNFTGLLRVRDKERWQPRYVFYALFANYQLGGTKRYENRTTGLHNLQTDQYVKELSIEHKPISEQQKIVYKLDKVAILISLRKKQLQKLDDLVKARFVEMFGDEKHHLSLQEVCSIITDGTHQPPKFVPAGIPFIFVSNIVGNTITYEAEKYIDQATYDELIRRTPIEIGDILLSTVGSYGHPAVVKSDRKFLFQRHIAYLKPKHNIVNSDYLHGAILSSDAQQQIEEAVKGIAQKTLNLSEIRKITIPVPPLEVQSEFAAFVSQVDKSKLSIQQVLEKLETLKKSLMQQYFG